MAQSEGKEKRLTVKKKALVGENLNLMLLNQHDAFTPAAEPL